MIQQQQTVTTAKSWNELTVQVHQSAAAAAAAAWVFQTIANICAHNSAQWQRLFNIPVVHTDNGMALIRETHWQGVPMSEQRALCKL